MWLGWSSLYVYLSTEVEVDANYSDNSLLYVGTEYNISNYKYHPACGCSMATEGVPNNGLGVCWIKWRSFWWSWKYH